MSRPSRNRNWVFTLNFGGAAASEASLKADETKELLKDNRVNWYCFQVEQGESGTVHSQGYFQLSNPVSLRTCKSILPGAHFQVRRGSHSEAYEYVRKEDTRLVGPFEDGVARADQGARTDINEVIEVVDVEAEWLNSMVFGGSNNPILVE